MARGPTIYTKNVSQEHFKIITLSVLKMILHSCRIKQFCFFFNIWQKLRDKLQCFQPVDRSTKLFLAHGVICGMEYLHSIQPHPVIHGDLKTQNVLLGDGLVAKVCVN